MSARKRLAALEAFQEEARRDLDRIVTALIARDPPTGAAADAFDGLRRSVTYAAQERRRMLGQLALLADALDRGATLDTLRERSAQWCTEAGLERYDDPGSRPDLFKVVGTPAGDGELAVVEAAWLADGVVVKRGVVEPVAPVAEAEEPADAEEPKERP